MDAFQEWWMLQSKMPYRNPEEIARMGWEAAKARAAKVCDEQADRARTSPGSARACACADRIRAL